MDTRTFLALVVPREGVKYLAEPASFKKDGKVIPFFRHYPFDTFGQMADAAVELDEQGRTVYFACASYLPEEWIEKKNGGGRKLEQRTARLARYAKAMWVDVDCGEGKPYVDQKEGIRALFEFCAASGLPLPMVVSSGKGLHAYWVWDKELPSAQWVEIAVYWRAVLRFFGLKCDPARDKDIASVLRPVGTHNRKADSSRIVKVLRPHGPLIVTREWMEALMRIVRDYNIPLINGHTQDKVASINSDLAIIREYPDSSAHVLVAHCAQMREFAAMKGDVDEPFWRAALGLLKHTTEGDEIAHEWSSGHPEYAVGDCQDKLDRWTAGPTTCGHFDQVRPEVCRACPQWGKISSPIQLGYTAPPEREEVKSVETDTGEKKEVRFLMPEGYEFRNGKMVHFWRNADGVEEVHPFCSRNFAGQERVRDVDGTWLLKMVMFMPNGTEREVTVPQAVIGAGGSQLFSSLGQFEILPSNDEGAKKHMGAYLVDQVNTLTANAREIITYDTMGWKPDDSFLLGQRIYKPNGKIAVAELKGTATILSRAFPVCGTPERWAAAINMMYARAGMEPMQYAIVNSFGSLLCAVHEDLNYKGIPIALTGGRSGRGKTTTGKLGLYAFGDAESFTINGQRGATANARSDLMGTLKNLPIMIDEITGIEPKELGALAYEVCNGGGRIRMVSSTGRYVTEKSREFSLASTLTANIHMGGLLSSIRANTEPEAVRIFEIQVDTYNIPILPLDLVRSVLQAAIENRGSAGDRYVKWLVTHKDELLDRLHQASDAIIRNTNDMDTNIQYRFFRQHAECTLASAQIASELGLLGFDIPRLQDWTYAHLNSMTKTVSEHNTMSSDDALNKMLTDLSPGYIVTYQCRDTRSSAPEKPERAPNTTVPTGRYIMGTAPNDPLRGTLYVSYSAMLDWCTKNRLDKTELLVAAQKQGALLHTDTRFYLGKGTTITTGQMRCLMFDTSKLKGFHFTEE